MRALILLAALALSVGACQRVEENEWNRDPEREQRAALRRAEEREACLRDLEKYGGDCALHCAQRVPHATEAEGLACFRLCAKERLGRELGNCD